MSELLAPHSRARNVWVIDALGQSTVIKWNALDRITQVTDPNLNATALAYDGNSNLLSVADSNNGQTSYIYATNYTYQPFRGATPNSDTPTTIQQSTTRHWVRVM